jgi:hypothetical protein
MFLLREVELAGITFENVTLNNELREVTLKLTSSKSDFMALGTTRTWGCTCGVSTLPCPFHLCQEVVTRALAKSRGQGVSEITSGDAPLFATSSGSVPLKAKFVETFEAVATQLGLSLLTAEGTRAYGGHSLRVTGAQSLAAHGIEVTKIRILARHSGEAILRYVAQAPLTTLRADLGLVDTHTQGQSSRAPLAQYTRRLDGALARLDIQAQQIQALQVLAVETRTVVYVENLLTNSIHSLRHGDASHTACGWNIGQQRQRRGGIRWLDTIQGCCWKSLCERCLLPERQAAKLCLGALLQDSSESEGI